MSEVPRGNIENDENNDASSDWYDSLPRDAEGNLDFDAMMISPFDDYHVPGFVIDRSTGLSTLIADEDQVEPDPPSEPTEQGGV